MLIDIHCHLDFFKDSEISEIIDKSKKSKVELILTNGTNLETNKKSLELSKKFPQVKPALGLYPIDALKFSDSQINKILGQIRSNKDEILAIGEVGMDFKENDDKVKQAALFKKIISLSKELDKPLIIHSRKAERETIDLLDKEDTRKAIMHCFSGKLNLVEKIISKGWSLSIPTCITNSHHFQKIAEITPLNQLFCETDSPFLHPFKEYPNHPYNVLESYKKIAEIKKSSLKKIEEQIEKNFRTLFVSLPRKKKTNATDNQEFHHSNHSNQ